MGLESVEELEVALDAMEGIAADGGELDPTNVSREARVRSAYLEWCKEYGKEVDESRFPTFTSNYLAMEQYAKENGKTMQLNMYADCTEEEYFSMTSTSLNGATTAEVEEVVAEDISAADAEAVAKVEEEAAAAELKAKEEAAAKSKAEEEAGKCNYDAVIWGIRDSSGLSHSLFNYLIIKLLQQRQLKRQKQRNRLKLKPQKRQVSVISLSSHLNVRL